MPILGIIASSKLSAVGDFQSIATVTLATTATITFSSIPSTYTHLQLRILAKTNRATYSNDLISLRFNGDTGSNYSGHLLAGSGSTVTAEGSASSTKIYYGGNVGGSTLPADTYGAAIIDILDYKDTNKYKTTRSLSGYDNNGAGTDPGIVSLLSGSWRNTAAITSITLLGGEGSSLLSGSTVALYGIKSA
jgi:hypothetical protein